MIPMTLSGVEGSMYTRLVRAVLDHLTIVRSSYYDRPQRSSCIPEPPVLYSVLSRSARLYPRTLYGVGGLADQCGIPRGKGFS